MTDFMAAASIYGLMVKCTWVTMWMEFEKGDVSKLGRLDHDMKESIIKISEMVKFEMITVSLPHMLSVTKSCIFFLNRYW